MTAKRRELCAECQKHIATEKVTIRMNVNVDADDYEAYQGIVEESGTTVSDAIRKHIREVVASRNGRAAVQHAGRAGGRQG